MSKNVSYARITTFDCGEPEDIIVMLMRTESQRENNEGMIIPWERFHCIEADNKEALEHSYELSDQFKPKYLGSYEEFTTSEQNIKYYRAILIYQREATGPLATIQVIDYMLSNKMNTSENNVLNAISIVKSTVERRQKKFVEQIAVIRSELVQQKEFVIKN